VYPGTPLANELGRAKAATLLDPPSQIEGEESLLAPVFYLSPHVGPELVAYVADLVAGDRRFLCPDPSSDLANYNYRENRVLVKAIQEGHRGAYWDILRRVHEGLPPA
jgi:hypothetical protein